MNKYVLTILIATLILFVCCKRIKEDCHYTINFINTTDLTLYVIASSEYPDTMAFKLSPNPTADPNFTKVLPEETNAQVLWLRDCIELAFKDLITSDTMMVYVFDAQVLDNSTWDVVKENYLILKRFDLSLEDLRKNNWKITYP